MSYYIPPVASPEYDRLLNAELGKIFLDISNKLKRQEGGTWSGYHPVIGGYNIWIDATGAVRIKDGLPTFDLDGRIIGGSTAGSADSIYRKHIFQGF